MKKFPFLAVVIAAALIAAVFLFLERMDQGPNDDIRRRMEKETPTVKRSTPDLEPGQPLSGHPNRRIALIIDDIGFDLTVVEELAGIPEPIAFAVLPHSPHAADAAELLHAAGKEILLHLPMEPRLYPKLSPGPGALMVGMDGDEIRRLIRDHLAEVPFVSGVNNHMGSRFMEDESRLVIVMEELKKKKLFFVDSRTTANSRGRASAEQTGIRFAARDVFIDAVPGYASALENLTGAFKRSKNSGRPVLMIGHPHKETARAVRDALPIWKKQGVEVIPVAACLQIPGGNEIHDPRKNKIVE